MNRTDATVFHQQMAVYARKSTPALRWTAVLTTEVLAREVQVGDVVVEVGHDPARVVAIGRVPDGLVLYVTSNFEDDDPNPTRRIRLRPGDAVLVPATRTRGGLPLATVLHDDVDGDGEEDHQARAQIERRTEDPAPAVVGQRGVQPGDARRGQRDEHGDQRDASGGHAADGTRGAVA